MCLTRPKTARGQRIIPLVPWMATALQRWQAVAPASLHGLVWPATDGRPRLARDDDAEWKQLQGIAKAKHPAGRTWAVHEARHTAATLLMVAGVPESVRIAILGHSQAAVTRQYEHADQTQALKALESVAGQLGWVG